MTFLLHGAPCAGQYLVDVGELVPVKAVKVRDGVSTLKDIARKQLEASSQKLGAAS